MEGISMEIWVKIILVIVFYCVMSLAYYYSVGKVNFGGDRQNKYESWVKQHGVKTRKSIRVLVLLFTIGILVEYLL